MPDSAVAELLEPTVNPDWELIRELYNSGIPLKAIETQTGVKVGTIAARASRARWREIATKAKQLVQFTEDCQESTPGAHLDSSSKRVRNALAVDLTRVVDLLEEKPAKSLASALKRQRQLEPAVRNAKVVFGWNEDSQSTLVNINLLAQATIAPANPNTLDTNSASPLTIPRTNPSNESYLNQTPLTQKKEIPFLDVSSQETDPMTPFDPGL